MPWTIADIFTGSEDRQNSLILSNICAMKIVATYGDDGHDLSMMIILPGVLTLGHWNSIQKLALKTTFL